ncbi:MAG: transcriptional repressor [Bacilli bacterium]
MKYSKQREVILQVVKESMVHPTAEMVYIEARKILPNISLGTVYRNLNSLHEKGYIKHIVMPNDSSRYDRTLNDHYHMYCEGCNKVFDISYDLLKHIDNIVSDETGYKVLSHNLVFTGLCHECLEKEGR